MKKIRAIYIGDVRFDACPVFELKENDRFEMLEDAEAQYEKEMIENDEDWLVFEVDTDKDKAKLITKDILRE